MSEDVRKEGNKKEIHNRYNESTKRKTKGEKRKERKVEKNEGNEKENNKTLTRRNGSKEKMK
jgi:hypothetical protein